MQIEPNFFYTFASEIGNAKALRFSTSDYPALALCETYTNQVWF
jgi:hypothetical protein